MRAAPGAPSRMRGGSPRDDSSYDPRPMSRPVRVLCALGATVATALLGAACGTQRIGVPTSQSALHHGAVLFQQRCAGCHSLSYAATFGSAANVFTAEFNNGP